MTSRQPDREALPDAPNPLGLDGIEYIEYTTSHPQALGQVLEAMGFRPVARHRSREVVLYRQGSMNLVINAHPGDNSLQAEPDRPPALSAVAFRVHDAAQAFRRCVDLGAWPVEGHAQAMELNVPAIHGPGGNEAMQLRVAEQYVTEFGKLAKAGNTLVLPANLSDIGSMIALATSVIKRAPGDVSGR